MAAVLEDKERFEVLEPATSKSFRRSFALDVLDGLSQRPKRISPVYLYDKRGSELFKEITTLRDYYLTQAEHEILSTCKEEIRRSLRPEPFNLIELGAGDGSKTMLLIDHFINEHLQFEYVALDISPESINELTLTLERMRLPPEVKVTGVVAEYFDGLKWLAGRSSLRNIVLFLGSNIGNFDYLEAQKFLRRLWDSLKPDDLLLIGFDLKKDIEVLNRAYNDPEGLTREFNMNLLDRINRELRGEFSRDKWLYYSGYDLVSGAVESYLVSTEAQDVFIGEIDKVFSFEEWEPIHTESSYKYRKSEIVCLAANTGFEVEKLFFDSRRYYADSLWKVIKPGTASDACDERSCR